MNRKPIEFRAKIIQLLCEGNSMRSTSRIMDCSINTVTKTFVDVATACEAYQDRAFVNLTSSRIQVDEIWSFSYAKNKNLPEDVDGGVVWTWVAIDPDTKLVPSWNVGSRDAATAKTFMRDLAGRLDNRVQLTSDGFAKYRDAVEDAFGAEVDFSQLIKIYDEENKKKQKYLGSIRSAVIGRPDMQNITTAHIERQNLTMRMSNRRFARKTNAFSKKFENHCHSVALHFFSYNFCRIHKSLRVTPAMQAGVTDHVWSYEELVALSEGTLSHQVSRPS